MKEKNWVETSNIKPPKPGWYLTYRGGDQSVPGIDHYDGEEWEDHPPPGGNALHDPKFWMELPSLPILKGENLPLDLGGSLNDSNAD